LAVAVDKAAGRLVQQGFAPPDARVDAGVLARALLGWDVATWLIRHQEPAPGDFSPRLEAWIARRGRHEPVAYITGEREFFGRLFRVTPDVLIPRPETEFVVEAALEWARLHTPSSAPDSLAPTTSPRPRAQPLGEANRRLAAFGVLDVGTGSGCLAVTLACELPRAAVTATDVSSDALIVARDNAARHHVADRIAVVEGPLFADQAGPWDLIVSNPPYVPRRDYDGLAADVRDFEPRVALLGGDDGLEVIRAITRAAAGALAPAGLLVMEIGAGQGDAVRALIDETTGLSWTRVLPDLQGIPRVVVATCCRP